SPSEELVSQRITTDSRWDTGAGVGGGTGGTPPLAASALARIALTQGFGGLGLSACDVVGPLGPSAVLLTFFSPPGPLPGKTVSDIINLADRFLGGGRWLTPGAPFSFSSAALHRWQISSYPSPLAPP